MAPASLALLLLAGLAGRPAQAGRQDRRARDSRDAEGRPKKAKEKQGRERKKPKPEPVLAIVGADIETVTRGTIRRGTILIRDGKIEEVGQGVDVPEGAEVIDATGKVVTPGFVAVDMDGVGVGYAASSRENKVADALDPFDRNMKYCLGVGITAGAVQVGGSSGPAVLLRGRPRVDRAASRSR